MRLHLFLTSSLSLSLSRLSERVSDFSYPPYPITNCDRWKSLVRNLWPLLNRPQDTRGCWGEGNGEGGESHYEAHTFTPRNLLSWPFQSVVSLPVRHWLRHHGQIMQNFRDFLAVTTSSISHPPAAPWDCQTTDERGWEDSPLISLHPRLLLPWSPNRALPSSELPMSWEHEDKLVVCGQRYPISITNCHIGENRAISHRRLVTLLYNLPNLKKLASKMNWEPGRVWVWKKIVYSGVDNLLFYEWCVCVRLFVRKSADTCLQVDCVLKHSWP